MSEMDEISDELEEAAFELKKAIANYNDSVTKATRRGCFGDIYIMKIQKIQLALLPIEGDLIRLY